MAFLRESDVRARARRRAALEGLTVDRALRRASEARHLRYDIFLSQTIRDAELVLGVYDVLTGAGYTVFCDWIHDPASDRGLVTPANAAFVRATMGASDSLLFLDSKGADQSHWMCWELGWFDGARGTVAVLPVLSGSEQHYRGREFLGLYPYIEIDGDGRLRVVRPAVAGQSGITVFEAPNYRSFDFWRRDPQDYMRPRVIGDLGR